MTRTSYVKNHRAIARQRAADKAQTIALLIMVALIGAALFTFCAYLDYKSAKFQDRAPQTVAFGVDTSLPNRR
jgi:hypothetical protein